MMLLKSFGDPASDDRHPASDDRHQASDDQHPASDGRHPASDGHGGGFVFFTNYNVCTHFKIYVI
jgi:hypothetical protein